MSNEQPTIIPSAYCTAGCARVARVSEQFAFYGRDRQRMTLACGHVVIRPDGSVGR